MYVALFRRGSARAVQPVTAVVTGLPVQEFMMETTRYNNEEKRYG
jgi:hypothetical protein